MPEKQLFSFKRHHIIETLKELCSCSIIVQVDEDTELDNEELWTIAQFARTFPNYRYRKWSNHHFENIVGKQGAK